MALAAFAAYHVPAYMEEGDFSDAAYNLSHHGFMGTTVLETAGTGLTRIDQPTYRVMPLYLVGQALWMLEVPPSLLGVRLFSVLWIPVSVCALYVFMRRIGCGQMASLAGAVLDGLSFTIVDAAKNARPDMMCQALGWSALALYVATRKRSLLLALCAGNLLVALSGLTHPNGVLYFAGIWFLAFWFDRRNLRWTHLAAAASVYLAVGGLWSIYIRRDPVAFADQLHANADRRFPVASWSAVNLWLPFRLVWAEIHDRYLVLFGLLSPFRSSRLKGLVLLTYAAALCIAATRLRRHRDIQTLLCIWAVFFGIQCVFNQKIGFYFAHIQPIYAALAASVAAAIWRLGSRGIRVALAAWLALIVAIQPAFVIGKSISLSTAASRHQVADFLARNARGARLIIGSACLIHTVGYDPRYRDDRYLGTLSGQHADVVVMADHIDDAVYGKLRTEKPSDWARIRQRLSEYRLVFAPRGFQIYFASTMPDPQSR